MAEHKRRHARRVRIDARGRRDRHRSPRRHGRAPRTVNDVVELSIPRAPTAHRRTRGGKASADEGDGWSSAVQRRCVIIGNQHRPSLRGWIPGDRNVAAE